MLVTKILLRRNSLINENRYISYVTIISSRKATEDGLNPPLGLHFS